MPTQSPASNGIRVGDIEQLLETRIKSGQYAVGERLPTVRELAHELGVHKNYTERAYQALKRKGYLELARGRGAFVRHTDPLSAAANTRWLSKLDHVLQEAKTHRLPRKWVVEEIQANLDRIYGRENTFRRAFVECNPVDVEMLTNQISQAIGYPLEGVLLSDLLTNPNEVGQEFDLVVTTFFHLSEVSWALPEELRHKVVGVLAAPTHDSLLNIARLRASVIGVVVTLASTIDNLVHIIHTYHPTATILAAQVDDEARLKATLVQADAIVVTRVTLERLMDLQPSIPVVEVTFTIDQQSMNFLRTRLMEQGSVLPPAASELEILRVHA